VTDFELCEGHEELFLQRLLAKVDETALEDGSRLVGLAMSLFEFGSLDKALGRREDFAVALEDGSGLINGALVPFFELDIGIPGILSWFPPEPPLEDGPDRLGVAKHLLHVSVLVPELVDSRQVLDGPLPHVAGVVHVLVLHLHLCVLQPQSDVLEIDFEGAFED